MSLIEKAISQKGQQDAPTHSPDATPEPIPAQVTPDNGPQRPLLSEQIDQLLSDETPHSSQPQSLTDSGVMDDTGVMKQPVRPSAARDAEPEQLTFDFIRLAQQGYLSPNSQLLSQHQEEYRVIKRKLLHNAFAADGRLVPRGNLILITSSHPQEGKTFNAVNLALSIALERDKTVLLIDGDVIKPSLNHTLGFSADQPGLLDYLDGSVGDIGQVIHSTNLPNLRLIPAGTPHALSNELLASERMQELMQELTRRYPDRVIILDSPPLLGISDTHVLSSYVGQAVYVVNYAKTTHRDVQQGLSQLPEGLATGLLLNRSRSPKEAGYDGYYGRRYPGQTTGSHSS